MRNFTAKDADEVYGPYVPSMDALPGRTEMIRLRRWDVLWQLPEPDRQRISPLEIGGTNGSHHSDDLNVMVRAGFVNRHQWSGYTRGSCRYRLSVKGFKLWTKIKTEWGAARTARRNKRFGEPDDD